MNQTIDWRRRAQAAERTVEVLKAKVCSLYDVGARTALHRQLERTHQRAQLADVKRARLEAERAQLAQINELLEAKVKERTQALQRVLDHVAFGFVVVRPDLCIEAGFSEACHALFARPIATGDALGELLQLHGDDRLSLELAFAQVFDDFMPDEVTLAQIPGRVVVGGRALHLTGRAIRDNGQITAVLLTVKDATDLEMAQADSRRHAALVSILHQRAAFEGFLADARDTLARARQCPDPVAVRRAVHTIKGNAASFDLHQVVAACHLAEEGAEIDLPAIGAITEALRDFLRRHRAVLRMDWARVDGQRPLTVEPGAHTRLRTIAQRPGMEALRTWLADVSQHPIEALIGPLPNFAERLGERLGKPVRFHLQGGAVRVDREIMQPILRTLPHLVHNAVDHGIEPAWAREGKAPEGQLWLTVTDHAAEWHVTMRDDGRGIVTTRLLARAVDRGLLDASSAQALSRAERLALVFVDGLSSAEQTTDISGRGVGMSAVHAAVGTAGGRIELASTPGRGTTVDIIIPKPEALRPTFTTRLVLIDPDDAGRAVLARRLIAQGYDVDQFGDAAKGANAALIDPPSAVVADLWMSGISGVQLCRLLNTEPATCQVAVILRATDDTPRDRFWARHAGAAGYVAKGRMGELVRTLKRVVSAAVEPDFFFQLSGGATDVRDRIAARLDEALFDSVVASEVRVLGVLASFDQLVDQFSQLLVQITPYRWMALSTVQPPRLGLHCRPEATEAARQAAQDALDCPPYAHEALVEDDDAEAYDAEGPAPIVVPIRFGDTTIGRLAVAPTAGTDSPLHLLQMAAHELAGPLRIVALVEETRRLATIDGLTGLARRDLFTERLVTQLDEANPLVLALLDLDNFKQVNDHFGHAVGDQVLAAMGGCLSAFAKRHGAFAARWGGEEFVLAFPGVTLDAGAELAEALCAEIRLLDVHDGNNQPLPVSASIGLAVAHADDCPVRLTDRADRAMYVAKSSGRDRVCTEADLPTQLRPKQRAAG
jgi:diguanylate cyclase (GGDEF)-like protein